MKYVIELWKSYKFKRKYCRYKYPKSKVDGKYRLGDKCCCCNKII